MISGREEKTLKKVFIVQKNDKADYTDAMQFGSLNFIASTDYKVYDHATAMAILELKLNEFKEDDLLLLTGDPILIGLACHIVFNKFNKVNMLKWDKRRMTYQLIEVLV